MNKAIPPVGLDGDKHWGAKLESISLPSGFYLFLFEREGVVRHKLYRKSDKLYVQAIPNIS